MEQEKINWTDFERFWTPTPNTEVTVILSGWRQTKKTFNGNEKITLTFDVWRVEDEEYKQPLEYNTTGGNALKYKPHIINAEKRGEDYLELRIRCGKDKKIDVADMKTVKEIVNKRYGDRK